MNKAKLGSRTAKGGFANEKTNNYKRLKKD